MQRSMLLIFLAFRLLSTTLESSETLPLQANSDEINRIDLQIQELQDKLQEYRKRALQNEMQAQPQMFDDWSKFIEEISASEEDEKQILEIRKQLDLLLKRRQELKTK